jgi:hypothetical protein
MWCNDQFQDQILLAFKKTKSPNSCFITSLHKSSTLQVFDVISENKCITFFSSTCNAKSAYYV